jgi:hypothetical protein
MLYDIGRPVAGKIPDLRYKNSPLFTPPFQNIINGKSTLRRSCRAFLNGCGAAFREAVRVMLAYNLDCVPREGGHTYQFLYEQHGCLGASVRLEYVPVEADDREYPAALRYIIADMLVA